MSSNTVTHMDNSKGGPIRRKRRHWYQHEKLSIIAAYDKGDLLPVPGEPRMVIDPKSKEILSIFLIEDWKDMFRGLGLIKKAEVKKPEFKPGLEPLKTGVPTSNSELQKLLINAMLENQKLKEQLNDLHKDMGHKKPVRESAL